MCKFATDKKLSMDIILLYGNNTEKDIIFRDNFDQMQQSNPNLRVVYTLTSSDVDKNNWQGRTGLIDAEMIKEEIPDFTERTFFVCGPPKMVKSLSSILTDELNLTEDKVKTEDFPGY
jgi:ferredoxin-NADP reductase